MTTDEPQSVRDLLLEWRLQTKQIYRAHYQSAIKARNISQSLGLASATLSVITSLKVFSSLGESSSLVAQVVVGICTFTAALLATLQTFLRADELVPKYQTAGAAFASLHREISLRDAALLTVHHEHAGLIGRTIIY